MQKTLEKNRTFRELKQQLALERINRISDILNYRFGLNTFSAQHKNVKDFAIFITCDCCGEVKMLVRYSAEQLINLDIEDEIINLLQKVQS